MDKILRMFIWTPGDFSEHVKPSGVKSLMMMASTVSEAKRLLDGVAKKNPKVFDYWYYAQVNEPIILNSNDDMDYYQQYGLLKLEKRLLEQYDYPA